MPRAIIIQYDPDYLLERLSMAASNRELDSIKLIGSWSKWLIAIHSAGIGILLESLKAEKGSCPIALHCSAKLGLSICLGAYLAALIAAGGLQSGLSLAVTDLHTPATPETIWNRKIYFWNRSFGEIWLAAEIQFALFLIGIVAFCFSVLAFIV